MDSQVQKLQAIIDGSDNIVFFGGAGVSTASGIPDYRGTGGLFSKPGKYPPEVRLSVAFYEDHKEEYYAGFQNDRGFLSARPNAAHRKLAELEQAGKLKAVITQNIDGLHQRAGSKTVYELHGSIYRCICQGCHRQYTLDYILGQEGIPQCGECGGEVKPDVVLYGQALDRHTLESSRLAVENADVLIVGGTSLAVYPAAGLVPLFGGSHLVIINKSPTDMDHLADLHIVGDIAEILGAIVVRPTGRG